MRQLIKSTFSMFGLDVRFVKNLPEARKKQKHDDLIARWRLLKRYSPRTILDIGANEGQCAALLREAFPHATIYSFEPLKDCCSKVQAFLADNGPGKALPFALGDQNGVDQIHRNDFTPSSSLLPMQEMHHEEYPQTVNSTSEEITIRRLDDVIDELQEIVRHTYRDRLEPCDLADPTFADECRLARERLLEALNLTDLA